MAHRTLALPGRSWFTQAIRNLARVRCSQQGHLVQAIKVKGSRDWSYYCGRGCGVHLEMEYRDE